MKNKLTIFFYLVLCSFAFTQELVITEDPVPDNSAPIITNSSGQAFNDAPVNIQLEVSDQDGDDLTFTILTQPSNGSVIITQTQSGPVATYTPNASFTGDDSFTYKANDGSEDSNTDVLFDRVIFNGVLNVVEKCIVCIDNSCPGSNKFNFCGLKSN